VPLVLEGGLQGQGLTRLVTSRPVTGIVTRLPGTAGLASRYVPGESVEELLAACRALVDDGFWVGIELHLAEAHDEAAAESAATTALDLLDALHTAGLARRTEISLTLAGLGQLLPELGAKVSLENAGRIARAARVVGSGLLLDLGAHGAVDASLQTLRELRKDFPEVGAGLAANLRRTEDDCRALAFEGSRVRLTKGSRRAPATVAFADRHDADKSYVRCLKVLLAGQGMPVVSTHDPRLVRIAGALATRFDRPRGSYEYQMRYGVRSDEQRRLSAAGDRVRVLVPFGQDGSGYLLRRLADRGPDLTSFLRSLLPQR